MIVCPNRGLPPPDPCSVTPSGTCVLIRGLPPPAPPLGGPLLGKITIREKLVRDILVREKHVKNT
jgi:hypothetical protein